MWFNFFLYRFIAIFKIHRIFYGHFMAESTGVDHQRRSLYAVLLTSKSSLPLSKRKKTWFKSNNEIFQQ